MHIVIEGKVWWCLEGFSIHVECHEEIIWLHYIEGALSHPGSDSVAQCNLGCTLPALERTTYSTYWLWDIGSHWFLTLEVCCGAEREQCTAECVTEWFMVAEDIQSYIGQLFVNCGFWSRHSTVGQWDKACISCLPGFAELSLACETSNK